MNKVILLTCAVLFSSWAHAASNTSNSLISYYETRASGTHSVYLVGPMSTLEGCNINDRGAVVDGDAGSKTMSAMILFALANNKQVSLRVSGCTAVDPGTTATTVPRIVKVQLIN